MEIDYNLVKENMAQITFKLSWDDRLHILTRAEKLGISISDYIRFKCINGDPSTLAPDQKDKVDGFEKEADDLRSQLQECKQILDDPTRLTIKVEEEELSILETVFANYGKPEQSLTYKLMTCLINLVTEEDVWDDLFGDTDVTAEEFYYTFFPEQSEENGGDNATSEV